MKPVVPKLLLAFLLGAAPLLAIGCGVTYSPPPPDYPSRDIEGSRYETMRVLSERLVERLEGLRDELRATRNTRAETPELSDLVERARRFRDRMQNYSNPPRSVESEVDELDRLARDYDARTRNVSASPRAVDYWRDVQDIIDRMRRVLAGENVDIPPRETGSSYPYPYPTPSYPTYPPGPSGGYGSVLSGSALEDFRRSAHETVVRATLARDGAERVGGSYSESSRRVLADMSYVVSGARDLESRVSASSVYRSDLRSSVDRVLEDARRIDRAMRDSNVYPGAWTDWTEVVRLLQRMADQVR